MELLRRSMPDAHVFVAGFPGLHFLALFSSSNAIWGHLWSHSLARRLDLDWEARGRVFHLRNLQEVAFLPQE